MPKCSEPGLRMYFLVRLRLAFQQRTGPALQFGLIASQCSLGTLVWHRDYHAREQKFLGWLPNEAAVPMLSAMLHDLQQLRWRAAHADRTTV